MPFEEETFRRLCTRWGRGGRPGTSLRTRCAKTVRYRSDWQRRVRRDDPGLNHQPYRVHQRRVVSSKETYYRFRRIVQNGMSRPYFTFKNIGW